MNSSFSSRIRPLVPLLLVLVTLLVFLPTTKNEFINYDDPDYIFNNPWVQQGLSWGGIKWAFTEVHASNWHPLTWISHMIDCQVYGTKAAGHHFVSVLLHGANTFLLFWLLRKMTGAFWRPIFVAALFGLHPMHVESVAWVAERKDLLSTFFGLLSILFYLSYARKDKPAGPPANHALNYVLSLLCFGLGLLSKPMLVTWPFVLLLLDVWPLQRLSVADKVLKPNGNSSKVMSLLLEKIPFFGLTLISICITIWAQKIGGSILTAQQLPFGLRFQNALVSYGVYLKKLIWPVDLAVFYPYLGSPSGGILAITIVLLVGITIGAALSLRRRPYVFVGWFWFIGTLVPVIGIIQVGDQALADRYTYVPYIGLLIAMAWLLENVTTKLPKLKAPLVIAALVTIAASALGSSQQIRVWKNTETLFEHALEVTDKNYLAAAAIANERWIQRKPDEALPLLAKALEWKPHFAEGHFALGNILLGRETERALQAYATAIRYQPNNPEMNLVYGLALLDAQRFDEAEKTFEKSIQLQPESPNGYSNLGISLLRQKKYGQAIRAFESALKVAPKFAPAYLGIGQSLAALEKYSEAHAAFKQALQLEPGNPQAHLDFALFLESTGRPAEAVAEYRETVRLRPEAADAWNNLAWLLATADDPTIRSGKEAVKAGEIAAAVTQEKVPIVLGTLAAAYAESGRFDDAERTARKAMTLAEKLNQPQVMQRNAALLELYRNGKTARELSN